MQTVDANEPGCFKCHGDKRGPFSYEHAPVPWKAAPLPPAARLRQPAHVDAGASRLPLPGVPRQLGAAGALRQRDHGTVPPSFHDMRLPRFQNCTICHQKVHGPMWTGIFSNEIPTGLTLDRPGACANNAANGIANNGAAGSAAGERRQATTAPHRPSLPRLPPRFKPRHRAGQTSGRQSAPAAAEDFHGSIGFRLSLAERCARQHGRVPQRGRIWRKGPGCWPGITLTDPAFTFLTSSTWRAYGWGGDP